jgi:uncharacterized membrane protein
MGRSFRLLTAISALAAVAGAAISVYLTVVHYSAAPLVCSTGGAVNCELVLSSPNSVIAGSSLPTSAAGIIWFAVSAMLAAAQLAGRGSPFVVRAGAVWSVIGLATVAYLVFVEIVELGAICIWCTSAHALVVLIFLITLTTRDRGPAHAPAD